MSKYEDAIRTKAVNEQLIEKFENQLATEDRCYTGLVWQFNGFAAGGDRSPFQPTRASSSAMNFSTCMFHGHYSSGHTISDSIGQAGEEIAKTLGELKELIIPRTIARLRKEIKDAAAAAKDEARAILAHAQGDDE